MNYLCVIDSVISFFFCSFMRPTRDMLDTPALDNEWKLSKAMRTIFLYLSSCPTTVHCQYYLRFSVNILTVSFPSYHIMQSAVHSIAQGKKLYVLLQGCLKVLLMYTLPVKNLCQNQKHADQMIHCGNTEPGKAERTTTLQKNVFKCSIIYILTFILFSSS